MQKKSEKRGCYSSFPAAWVISCRIKVKKELLLPCFLGGFMQKKVEKGAITLVTLLLGWFYADKLEKRSVTLASPLFRWFDAEKVKKGSCYSNVLNVWIVLCRKNSEKRSY